MKGVDVHGDKGAIDWRRVKAAGFEFAFLKATEGRTFDDQRFSFNRRAAKAAGLVVGAYHFARPDNNTPEAEVQHFLRIARPKRGELIPALDWETNPPTAAWASRFLHALENEIGTPPIFYTFPDFLRRTGHFGDFHRFPLWYSRFGPNDGQLHSATPPQGFRFVVHQFTSAGHVDGIGGRADLNLLKLDSLRPLVFEPAAGGGGAGGGGLLPDDEGDIPAEAEAELPPNAEGEGFAGGSVEEDERERLEVEEFEAVPTG
jgi:GH25 family lysozyme M1 (1,4-beta-N-acetylmuramidase)